LSGKQYSEQMLGEFLGPNFRLVKSSDISKEKQMTHHEGLKHSDKEMMKKHEMHSEKPDEHKNHH
jgi:hypothetical protein